MEEKGKLVLVRVVSVDDGRALELLVVNVPELKDASDLGALSWAMDKVRLVDSERRLYGKDPIIPPGAELVARVLTFEEHVARIGEGEVVSLTKEWM